MKEFIKYTPEGLNADNAQNLLFEMAASCLANGDRIIVEQGEERGEKYIMVDFMPTDYSTNPGGYEFDGTHVCQISSVFHDDEGDYFSEHVNYFDALNEVARIIREDGFTEIYVESY